jgi:hypothetical protein
MRWSSAQPYRISKAEYTQSIGRFEVVRGPPWCVQTLGQRLRLTGEAPRCDIELLRQQRAIAHEQHLS